MRHESHRRRIVRRGSLVAAITMAVALLVALPALAAPAPTSWTVSPSSKTITYGQGVMLNGTLTSGATAVGGLWVDFYQATTESGSADSFYMVTSPEGPYATGQYSIAVIPAQTMYYQFRWAGDGDFEASNSDVIPVQVKPSLGKPSCTKSIKKNKKFTVKGTVKPGQGVGPAVKIRAYRRNSSGAYVSVKTWSTTRAGTQYKATISIKKTGKFKFKAWTNGTDQYAANQSGYSKVLTVKK
jgi:hypothetical protein